MAIAGCSPALPNEGRLNRSAYVCNQASGLLANRPITTYVPSLGVLILIVWGAWELPRRWRYQVLGISVASGAALVCCLTFTRHQIGYGKDGEAVCRHVLEVTKITWVAGLQEAAAPRTL